MKTDLKTFKEDAKFQKLLDVNSALIIEILFPLGSTGEWAVMLPLISRLELSLPMTFDYLTWDFQRNVTEDLNKAEN